MQIKIDVSGLDVVRKALEASVKQTKFAASKALTTTAFDVNKQIKADLQRVFQGGATKYTLSAFEVKKASKTNLEASVMLRTDAPSNGGTPYSKSLGHLFTGGTRDWKKLEGYLRGRKLMPAGLMLVPGPGVKLDARGNIPRSALAEMLSYLGSASPHMRIFPKQGRSKVTKAVSYFVVLPGSKAGNQTPGIYKRIEVGTRSTIVPMVLYVRRGNWRKFIDLKAIGDEVVGRAFAVNFTHEFEAAMKSAK